MICNLEYLSKGIVLTKQCYILRTVCLQYFQKVFNLRNINMGTLSWFPSRTSPSRRSVFASHSWTATTTG